MQAHRLTKGAGIATLVAMLVAVPVHAAPPEGFEARVEALRKASGVPGMSIAIVEQGKPTLARGFGVRKLGEPAPVGPDTIFPTGSTGKAVTVAALATLVDAGKIGWDDKVVDRLPGFQMYDAWVTREMTIRDLLVHRSGLGLGAGDLLFVPRTQHFSRRSCATPPLHQARDQFPQRLCLRQRALHGGRPAHRSGQRRDLGRVRAQACVRAGADAAFNYRRGALRDR